MTTFSWAKPTSAHETLSDGTTPLHQAIYHDQTDTALQLLRQGADAATTNRYGITPLNPACVNGNAKLIAALLAAGADPEFPDPGGMTPLMIAARTGRPEPIRLLLKAGADPNTRDRKDQTALMWAAVQGYTEASKLLLQAGADRDASLRSGFTPMFFAARQGHIDVVKLLLADGANVNATMKSKGGGRAPRPQTSALILATENGHFELAAHLLQAGADANDLRSGYTPLHVLSWARKPRRGDGIDGAPPPRGSGAMTSLEFVDVLVAHGADVNLRLIKGPTGHNRLGHPGATPFLLAARTADLPLMKKLIQHEANTRIPNRLGRNPLLAATGVALGPEADEAASEDESVAAVRFLLDHGADINVIDKEGNSTMHAAAFKQSPKLVHLLAENGADIKIWNRKNKHGWTPLRIARGFRNGNYKPSEPTIAALIEVMTQASVPIPKAPPPPGTDQKKKYQP